MITNAHASLSVAFVEIEDPHSEQACVHMHPTLLGFSEVVVQSARCYSWKCTAFTETV